MDPALLIGFILAGCVPTTIASNVVMTRQAGGNTPLTVVQSTIGNFLGPFLTPLLLKMYTSTGAWYTHVLPPASSDSYGHLYRRVFQQLGLSIFLPMFLGQILQHLLPNPTHHTLFTTYKLSRLGSLSLLTILWSAYDSAFSSGAFSTLPGSNILFTVFASLGFFVLFLAICIVASLPWLPRADVVSVAYCVPAKTPAIGIPLSQVLFVGLSGVTRAKIQIPMVVYQGLQVAGGSLLTIPLGRWTARAGERDGEG
ncbi:MAG: hypothetical protein M1828_003727 [Chrysothrix sp. TS-e1954]|nr:MAG: hypothetical protein M1828_003727 [Chrysothrix sp. TS-e1954]